MSMIRDGLGAPEVSTEQAFLLIDVTMQLASTRWSIRASAELTRRLS